MGRAQSSLEYLLMIAMVLVIVAVVISVASRHVKVAENLAGEGVVIAYVEYNPPGDDVSGEYVLIKNEGLIDVDMSGWQLKDEQNHVFTFPNGFILKAGASVKVHTGSGEDTDTNLYWGRDRLSGTTAATQRISTTATGTSWTAVAGPETKAEPSAATDGKLFKLLPLG